MRLEVTCAECGRGFMAYPSAVASGKKFCSRECQYAARKGIAPWNKGEKTCVSCGGCGKQFLVQPSQLTDGRGKFCSKPCALADRVGKPAWNKGVRVEKACLTCGGRFGTTPSLAERRKYCSRACSHEGQRAVTGETHPLSRPKVAIVCDWCGKPFETHQCLAEQKKFCSRECNGAASTAKQGGRRSSLEVKVEAELKRLGISHEPQRRVGKFNVDFLLPDTHTVLECDGDYWHALPKVAERDRRKDAWLQAQGFTVVRLTEADIRADVARCIALAVLPE